MPVCDLLHGDGEITLSVENDITYNTLQVQFTLEPDYKLYLTPKYVDTTAVFEAMRAQKVPFYGSRHLNFLPAIPPSVNANDYLPVLVWYEKFSMFMSSAQLK